MTFRFSLLSRPSFSSLLSRLSLFLLGLLDVVHMPGYPGTAPAFTLIALYHLVIYRPDWITTLSLCILGILQDGIKGNLLGMTAIKLITFNWLVLSQRRFLHNKNFPLVWGSFALISGLLVIVHAMLAYLLAGTNVNGQIILIDYGMTLLFYPCIVSLFIWLQKKM